MKCIIDESSLVAAKSDVSLNDALRKVQPEVLQQEYC